MKKKHGRALTIEEQQRFIEVAKINGGEIFILMLTTGLRVGEALALTWNDIDFDNGILSVSKTLGYTKGLETDAKYKAVIGSPKTKSSHRVVPLLPGIIRWLKEIREVHINESYLYQYNFDDNSHVFHYTSTGNPILSSSIWKLYDKIAKTLDIKGSSPHSLRHPYVKPALKIFLRIF